MKLIKSGRQMNKRPQKKNLSKEKTSAKKKQQPR